MSPALVGREADLRWLVAAIEDFETPLVVVGGPSGAGKTALVEAALTTLAAAPVTGWGRYLGGGARSGFSPMLRALAQIAEGALDLLYEPKDGLAALKAALGGGLDALIGAGFVGDRDFLGPAAAVPRAVGESETGARIIDAAVRLVRWLDGFGAPMVLVIDDWQRAPPQAAALLAALIRAPGRGTLTVILCERGETLRAQQTLRLIGQSRLLGGLAAAEQAALLGRAFDDATAGAAVAQWLGPTGPTLPFDLIQIARSLADAEAVVPTGQGWRVDPGKAAGLGREDVSLAILGRMSALPPSARNLALALALWGEPAALAVMARALERPPSRIAADVARLRLAGVLAAGEALAIAHDRLAAVLRADAAAGDLSALAGRMAEALISGDSGAAPPPALLALRLAAGLDGADPALWRDPFAEGAALARRRADTQAAGDFAEAALSLRQATGPTEPAADRLILREALMAAASRADADLVRARAADLIALPGGVADLAHAYELIISAARRAGDLDQAWDWAVAGLAAFKVALPAKPSVVDLALAVAAWRAADPRWSPRRPANVASERAMDAFASLANACGAIAFERRSDLAFLVALKAATRVRRLRLTSDVWASADVFISACLTDYTGAARIARRSALSERATDQVRGMTLYRRLYFGDIWTRPARELRPFCAEVYDLALAEGDLITAGFALRNDILLGWRSGARLDQLAIDVDEAEVRAERLGQASVVVWLRTMRRLIHRLTGLDDDFDRPLEDGYVEALPAGAANERHGYRMTELECAGLLGDWGKALRLSDGMRRSGAALDSHPGGLAWRFHETLARLKLGLPARSGALKMLRQAAVFNPSDHAHRPLLLAAEDLRRRGRREASLPLFAEAAALADGGACSLEAIIALRCAAEASSSMGRMEAAAGYRARLEARSVAWGWCGRGAPLSRSEADPLAQQRLALAETSAAMAARADRAKARLLADVAHELRTPLQGMQGLLDLAAGQEAGADLSELRDVLASLRVVVDDLTDLGAHGSGGAALNAKVVDLAALVRAEAVVCAAGAGAGMDRVEVRISPRLPPQLWTDGPRVRQVLRNLLSNAFKYGGTGPITVAAAAEALGEGRAVVTLRVDDSGPGLGQTNPARLFEPFDRGGRDDAHGLGLGLALGRRIAERLGGALTAEDRPQGGARFTFTFESRAASAARFAPGAEPLRILLVEDVELSRRVLAALLRRDGHTVAEAGDGAQALALSRAGVFDLALVDMGLPDMDGALVLAALRQRTTDLPLVAVTASAALETVERARAAGADGVLIKPVSAADLSGEISRLFSRPQAGVGEGLDFAAEMAALSAGARQEIGRRGQALLSDAETLDDVALAAQAHRLGGLAGQFGARDVAAAALWLETDLAAPGAGRAAGLAALAQALSEFPPAA
jgi:signal transduction histidine kinase/DNA-binding response OmpR family regulator